MPKSARQVFCRPPMERMMRIHQFLQNGQYPNCTSLGREFEVCPRTIARDIEFMRDRLGLPIEWDLRRNGYFYIRPVEQFPNVPMSEAETFALLVAHKAINQYQATPFQKPLETAFRRLTGQLDQNVRFTLGAVDQVLSFRPFAPDDADLKIFQTLTRALRERRRLEFFYRNRGSNTVRRRQVNPYHLACIDNHWYLLGFDVDRQAMRTFSLNRIQAPKLLRNTFAIPTEFNPADYLRGSLGVFKGRDDWEVVVDFDAWAADEIRGRRWHPSQQFTELPRGMLRLSLRLNNIEEAERWLLSFGTHAHVIRPRALVERFLKTGQAFCERYSRDLEARQGEALMAPGKRQEGGTSPKLFNSAWLSGAFPPPKSDSAKGSSDTKKSTGCP